MSVVGVFHGRGIILFKGGMSRKRMGKGDRREVKGRGKGREKEGKGEGEMEARGRKEGSRKRKERGKWQRKKG